MYYFGSATDILKTLQHVYNDYTKHFSARSSSLYHTTADARDKFFTYDAGNSFVAIYHPKLLSGFDRYFTFNDSSLVATLARGKLQKMYHNTETFTNCQKDILAFSEAQ